MSSRPRGLEGSRLGTSLYSLPDFGSERIWPNREAAGGSRELPLKRFVLSPVQCFGKRTALIPRAGFKDLTRRAKKKAPRLR